MININNSLLRETNNTTITLLLIFLQIFYRKQTENCYSLPKGGQRRVIM